MSPSSQVQRTARRPMPSNYVHNGLQRQHLPAPADFFAAQGLTLVKGQGIWRSALCPFHPDHAPSLRVQIQTGAFRCMACGAKGGDVLAFYQLRHQCSFVAAAKALNAWGVV